MFPTRNPRWFSFGRFHRLLSCCRWCAIICVIFVFRRVALGVSLARDARLSVWAYGWLPLGFCHVCIASFCSSIGSRCTWHFGDRLPALQAERMTLQYMGTLKKTERDPALLPSVEPVPCADETVKAPRHLDVHLPVSRVLFFFYGAARLCFASSRCVALNVFDALDLRALLRTP